MPFNDDWVLVHNSIPPLRWLANICGSIGSWAMLRCVFAEEDNKPIAAKIYGEIYSLSFPLWQKYGSYYKKVNEIDEDL